MSGGGALICGGSSCTVEEFEFPAGINHKLLFKTNTMINTVCGTSMPAENCTDYGKHEIESFARFPGQLNADLRKLSVNMVGFLLQWSDHG